MTGFRRGWTITVRRGFEVDNFGGRTGPTETFQVHGVGIEPRVGGPATSSRDIAATGRTAVIEGFTLRSRDPWLDLGTDDEVILPAPFGSPDLIFQVDGEVGPWVNPISGRHHGAEVAVKRWQG